MEDFFIKLYRPSVERLMQKKVVYTTKVVLNWQSWCLALNEKISTENKILFFELTSQLTWIVIYLKFLLSLQSIYI